MHCPAPVLLRARARCATRLQRVVRPFGLELPDDLPSSRPVVEVMGLIRLPLPTQRRARGLLTPL
eukprot:11195194-Lingulodinium_polyedra.AAC.1